MFCLGIEAGFVVFRPFAFRYVLCGKRNCHDRKDYCGGTCF